LRALAGYADQSTPQAILAHYDQFTDVEKRDAVMTLCSRPASAIALLDAIDSGKIPRHDLAAFNVRQILALNDKPAEERLTKVWGPVRVASADKAAEVAKFKGMFNNEVMSHANPVNGRAVFNRTCAQCHTLFDSGGQVGPDLTGAQRTNMEYVLGKVLDPSAVVSKDYRMTVIKTKDGRVINGIVSQESDNAVTLKAPNETIVVQKGDIEKRKQADVSLMPEGMLAGMTQDEARDLLAYLASPSQVPLPKTAEPPTAQAH
jgi:putative heme-binding domain-containing protein